MVNNQIDHDVIIILVPSVKTFKHATSVTTMPTVEGGLSFDINMS